MRTPAVEKLRQLRDELVVSLAGAGDQRWCQLSLTDRLRREHILRQVEESILRLERKAYSAMILSGSDR